MRWTTLNSVGRVIYSGHDSFYPLYKHAGIKHLAYVIAAMVKVAANWHNIGVFLGVDPGKLDGFKKQYRRDCDRCLMATIHAWLAGG